MCIHIDINPCKTLFRLINHTTKMLIKNREKQLSFHVLNLLADYSRTMHHKQILHWESNHEVDYFDLKIKIHVNKYF